MRERLDRGTGSHAFSSLFPHLAVVHEEFSKSDHRPIVVDTENFAGVQHSRPSGPGRFEARWLREESIDTIIQTAWVRAKSIPRTSLAEATADIHKSLHRWDKEVLKGPRTRLRDLQKELDVVMTGPLDEEALDRQKQLQMGIEDLLEKEELYWYREGGLIGYERGIKILLTSIIFLLLGGKIIL